MELKRYFQMLRRWKWLVVLTFILTLGGTAALVLPQAWVYQSTGTWLIQSRFGDTKDDADAMDVLSRNVQIGASYATVARGSLIKDRAEAQLAPGIDTSGTDVSADVITDTNILSISVRGPDPNATSALATAIGQQTSIFVDSLNQAYLLTPIDDPKVSLTPVAPNKQLSLIVGGFLGIVLGVMVAAFAEYLEGPVQARALRRLVSASILRDRVRTEIARADAVGLPLTLGVLKLTRGDRDDPDTAPSREDLRRVGELLRPNVHGEMAVAHMGGGEFAAIFPDMARAEAREIMGRWRGLLSIVLQGDSRGRPAPKLRVGVCEYAEGHFVGDAVTTGVLRRLLDGYAEVDRPEPARPEGSSSPRDGDGKRKADETGNGKADRKPSEPAGAASRSSAGPASRPAPDRAPRTAPAAPSPRATPGPSSPTASPERPVPAGAEPDGAPSRIAVDHNGTAIVETDPARPRR